MTKAARERVWAMDLSSGSNLCVRVDFAVPRWVHNCIPTKVGRVVRIHHKCSVTKHTFVDSRSKYDGAMKVARRARPPLKASVVKAPPVQILVAESGPIQSQLLARALRARKHFKVDTV